MLPARAAKTGESLLESRFYNRPQSLFLSEAQKQYILGNPAIYQFIPTNSSVRVSCYRGPSMRSLNAGLSIFYVFAKPVVAGQVAMWYRGSKCDSLSETQSGGDYACDAPDGKGWIDGYCFELEAIPSYAHCINDMFSTEEVHTHELTGSLGRLSLTFLYDFCVGEAIESFAEYRAGYWWCRRACNYLSDQELLIFDGRLTPEERAVTTGVTAKDLKKYNARVQRLREELVLESQRKAVDLGIDRETGDVPERLTRAVRLRLQRGEIATAEHTALHVEARAERDDFFDTQAATIPLVGASDSEDTSGFGDESGETLPKRMTPLEAARAAKKKKRGPGKAARKVIWKQLRYHIR